MNKIFGIVSIPNLSNISFNKELFDIQSKQSSINYYLSINNPSIFYKYDCHIKYIIVYSGILFNKKDLKCKLRTLGYVFKTDLDEEVILNSYIYYKENCLKYFDGYFSFAIYGDNKLFIVRDKIGFRPLFYSINENFICFSNEIKYLLKSKLVDPIIDEFGLKMILTNTSSSISSYTPFKNIRCLKPGEYLIYEEGITSKKLYYKIPLLTINKHKDKIIDDIKRKLYDSSTKIKELINKNQYNFTNKIKSINNKKKFDDEILYKEIFKIIKIRDYPLFSLNDLYFYYILKNDKNNYLLINDNIELFKQSNIINNINTKLLSLLKDPYSKLNFKEYNDKINYLLTLNYEEAENESNENKVIRKDKFYIIYNDLQQILYNYYLISSNLNKTIIYPFLDVELLEYYYNLPNYYKISTNFCGDFSYKNIEDGIFVNNLTNNIYKIIDEFNSNLIKYFNNKIQLYLEYKDSVIANLFDNNKLNNYINNNNENIIEKTYLLIYIIQIAVWIEKYNIKIEIKNS